MEDRDFEEINRILSEMDDALFNAEVSTPKTDPYYFADLAQEKAWIRLRYEKRLLSERDRENPRILAEITIKSRVEEALENARNAHATSLTISKEHLSDIKKDIRGLKIILVANFSLLVYIFWNVL